MLQHANVQPHAGANANLAVYQALLEPGDTILAMRLDHGGHLTHGSPASITSRIWRFVSYGVTAAGPDGTLGEVIDFDQVADLAKAEQPRLIVAGSTAYARKIDPVPFREIADSVGALFMFDAAHPAGLIAGGVHPSPVGVADVTTLTTHKTLRGPRGGAILCGTDLAKPIDSAVFPGLQGGPLEHVIAAKAVAFAEAARPAFARYAAAVVRNAQALAAALAAEGFRLVSGGTDNHMVLVDLRPFAPDLTGKTAQEVLDRAGITCNRNTIPDDPRSPFVTSGLRLGTAAETTAGMGPAGDGPHRLADRPDAAAGRRRRRGRGDTGRGGGALRGVSAVPVTGPAPRRKTGLGVRGRSRGAHQPCHRSGGTPSCSWSPPWSPAPSPCRPAGSPSESATWRCPTGASSINRRPPTAGAQPCSSAFWWR